MSQPNNMYLVSILPHHHFKVMLLPYKYSVIIPARSLEHVSEILDVFNEFFQTLSDRDKLRFGRSSLRFADAFIKNEFGYAEFFPYSDRLYAYSRYVSRRESIAFGKTMREMHKKYGID
ncbi:hypothetical protein D3C81_1367840 [compost metagenome]